MSYRIESSNPNVAYVYNNCVIDSIFTLLPTVSTFIFMPGDYHLTDTLHITKNNVILTSDEKYAKDVHIYQDNSEKDGIAVNADGVEISHLSIHNHQPGKVALTIADSNNTTVKNCYIYGNTSSFSVFYAGPKNLTAGQSTLDAYTNGNLDSGNAFLNNVIYTKWTGDSISFSLQKNANFSGNIIRGGKVSIYMCQNSNITGNIVFDSTSNGFYVSLPSKNLNIVGNKIYECAASGIKFANQTEHGVYPPTSSFITVTGNKIYDAKYYAIELNSAIDVTIDNNNFISTDIYTIYAYQSSNIRITNNLMSYFKVAIWIENSNNFTIDKNLICMIYPDETDNILKIVDTNNVAFTNTTIKGCGSNVLYSVDSTSANFVADNITVDKFYTYFEEFQTLKYIS